MTTATEVPKRLSIRQAAFIGVGATVGAGIFSLLGAAGEVPGAAVWLSFLIAGAVAVLKGYSFAKFGARYPSAGGLLEYSVRGFGDGHVTGVLAWMVSLVLQSQPNFSSNYVKTQFAERGIIFTPADALLPAQKKVACLVANAGKPLTTGKQAECYAKYQIGIDLTLVDNGNTYFQSHSTATWLV